MKLTKKDLDPRVVEQEGTGTMMVPNGWGGMEEKEVRIFGFGLSQYQIRLSFAQDMIRTKCPTSEVTGCATTIEFDAHELEELFAKSEAFLTLCPGCRSALGLLKSKTVERSFFFGWMV